MPPLPAPDPSFVLRKDSHFENQINHISFMEHPLEGLCVLLSDQSGNIDIWQIESKRRRKKSLHIFDYCPKFSGQVGLIWTEVIFRIGSENCYLLTQCRDGSVYVFTISLDCDLEQKQCIRYSYKLTTNFCAFCKCDLLDTEANSILVVPVDKSGDNFFSVYNLHDAFECGINEVLSTQLSEIKCPKDYGLPMSVSLTTCLSHPLRIVAAFEIGCVVIFSLESTEVVGCLSLQKDKSVACPLTCIALRPDFSQIAVGSAEDTLSLLNVYSNESGVDLEVLKAVKLTNPGVSCVAFRPDDGRLLVSAGWDSRLRYFSTKSLKPLAVLTCHTSTVVALRFLGKRLFSACKEGKIACWDLYDNQ